MATWQTGHSANDSLGRLSTAVVAGGVRKWDFVTNSIDLDRNPWHNDAQFVARAGSIWLVS
jgi:hypothetical protein